MGIVEELNGRSKGALPGLIGMEILDADEGGISSRLELREELLAPNGYLHAATVVALADTSSGYGAFANLSAGAEGFATVELKTNFLGTARDGTIACEARLVHGGRTTQVWDATVTGASRNIALLRCTQMILYPRRRGRSRPVDAPSGPVVERSEELAGRRAPRRPTAATPSPPAVRSPGGSVARVGVLDAGPDRTDQHAHELLPVDPPLLFRQVTA